MLLKSDSHCASERGQARPQPSEERLDGERAPYHGSARHAAGRYCVTDSPAFGPAAAGGGLP
ncbi:MAG TPA: hypothetical protein VFY06_12050, partial [Verrucomicrobiae bacterium]|nr:hypothetical protein [Verrucomicrobiae bacterium]